MGWLGRRGLGGIMVEPCSELAVEREREGWLMAAREEL